jgi:hypothetical protein
MESYDSSALPAGASGTVCYYSYQSGSGAKAWLDQVWISVGVHMPVSYFNAYEKSVAGSPFQFQTNPTLHGTDRSGTYLLNYKEDNGQLEPIFGVVGMKGTHYVEISVEGVESPASVKGQLLLEISLLQKASA